MNEQKTRRERWETVAANRVQQVLDKIENLSKCSNTRNYEYGKEDVSKMMSVIKKSIREMEIQFNNGLKHSGEDDVFKF